MAAYTICSAYTIMPSPINASSNQPLPVSCVGGTQQKSQMWRVAGKTATRTLLNLLKACGTPPTRPAAEHWRTSKKWQQNDFHDHLLKEYLFTWVHVCTRAVPNTVFWAPGGYSRKQVQLSELTYSEMGNSEYPVPEQRIWVSSINSEYVLLQLSTEAVAFFSLYFPLSPSFAL